jgi:hypothetical protein
VLMVRQRHPLLRTVFLPKLLAIVLFVVPRRTGRRPDGLWENRLPDQERANEEYRNTSG